MSISPHSSSLALISLFGTDKQDERKAWFDRYVGQQKAASANLVQELLRVNHDMQLSIMVSAKKRYEPPANRSSQVSSSAERKEGVAIDGSKK